MFVGFSVNGLISSFPWEFEQASENTDERLYKTRKKTLRECKPLPRPPLEIQSRDHSIRYVPFSIGGPLEPSLYL